MVHLTCKFLLIAAAITQVLSLPVKRELSNSPGIPSSLDKRGDHPAEKSSQISAKSTTGDVSSATSGDSNPPPSEVLYSSAPSKDPSYDPAERTPSLPSWSGRTSKSIASGGVTSAQRLGGNIVQGTGTLNKAPGSGGQRTLPAIPEDSGLQESPKILYSSAPYKALTFSPPGFNGAPGSGRS